MLLVCKILCICYSLHPQCNETGHISRNCPKEKSYTGSNMFGGGGRDQGDNCFNVSVTIMFIMA